MLIIFQSNRRKRLFLNKISKNIETQNMPRSGKFQIDKLYACIQSAVQEATNLLKRDTFAFQMLDNPTQKAITFTYLWF